MTLTKNPLVLALAGGLVAALATAGPLVDDGVRPSEAVAIALAFLTGTGLTAVKTPAAEEEEVEGL